MCEHAGWRVRAGALLRERQPWLRCCCCCCQLRLPAMAAAAAAANCWIPARPCTSPTAAAGCRACAARAVVTHLVVILAAALEVAYGPRHDAGELRVHGDVRILLHYLPDDANLLCKVVIPDLAHAQRLTIGGLARQALWRHLGCCWRRRTARASHCCWTCCCWRRRRRRRASESASAAAAVAAHLAGCAGPTALRSALPGHSWTIYALGTTKERSVTAQLLRASEGAGVGSRTGESGLDARREALLLIPCRLACRAGSPGVAERPAGAGGHDCRREVACCIFRLLAVHLAVWPSPTAAPDAVLMSVS